MKDKRNLILIKKEVGENLLKSFEHFTQSISNFTQKKRLEICSRDVQLFPVFNSFD